MPKKGAGTQTPAAKSAFAWPDLQSCPRDHAELVTVDDDLPGVFLLHDVFPPSLCSRFIKTFSNVSMIPSPPAKRGEAQRTNDRFQIDDPSFALALWQSTRIGSAASSQLPPSRSGQKAVGLNSNIRVYRYAQGTYFGPHYDDDVTDFAAKRKSQYTLLLYLTGPKDGLKGGATSFYLPNSKDKIAVDPEAGMVLFHKHGPDCMLHEGEPVLQGEKWILRSDVMFA